MVSEQWVRPAPALRRGDGDSELARAAQTGAAGAYGELVRRYQDRIYTAICGMVGDREDALDLTQDTFLKAFVSLSSFRQEAGFYTCPRAVSHGRCPQRHRGLLARRDREDHGMPARHRQVAHPARALPAPRSSPPLRPTGRLNRRPLEGSEG